MKIAQKKNATSQQPEDLATEQPVQRQGASLMPPAFQMQASPMQMKQEGAEEESPTQLKAMNPAPAHDTGCGCAQCKADAAKAPAAQPASLQAEGKAPIQRKGVVQMKPGYLVSHNFMGLSVEVNPVMAQRLTDVQADLQAQYDALDPTTRPATLRAWAGLSSIKGWRSSSSKHGSGSAVDCNYDNQPYIPTRTGTTYGGEEGSATAATRALRQPATEVYDRAVNFMRMNPYDDETANVSARGNGESTADVYDRFKYVSDALAGYFSLVFQTNYSAVTRVPVADPEAATDDELLAAIPTSERKDEATGIAAIQAIMDDVFWLGTTTNSAREQYFRILRDYEIVRKPLQRGNPSTNPGNTRNPANGFLHMERHFVVAMADAGRLRWGICDFGATSSGDVHHFDLGTHAGYAPE